MEAVLMFKKKQDKFLIYLVDFAEHLNETTDYFVQYKIKDIDTLEEFANTIKEYEIAADNKVHKIIKDLNETFITPIEREDIMQLTLNLDDIIDGMEEFTDRKSTRLNSSHVAISYAVFCLKKKKLRDNRTKDNEAHIKTQDDGF